MEALKLHEFHEALGGRFIEVNGMETVGDYGKGAEEYSALTTKAVFLDLSFRSRLCLTGSDRVRFLHGQVTNDIRRLGFGEGCYAAFVTPKGRMQSDLNVYCLADELLLDFEPGLTQRVAERLERYIVADDVQVVDVAAHYGLLSVQGPKASVVVRKLGLFSDVPLQSLRFLNTVNPTLGELYLVNQPRLGTEGFDLFVPVPALGAIADMLVAATQSVDGCACGWQAWETARIEAGIPRFGLDMDESNLPQECGIEQRAVSYTKGCYIGQEVLNRIHTIGHVNRELCALSLAGDLKSLPQKGDKLFQNGREMGALSSVTVSPVTNQRIALAYVRREMNRVGTELVVLTAEGESKAKIIIPSCRLQVAG
jgi:folate-binding protein YgfZ